MADMNETDEPTGEEAKVGAPKEEIERILDQHGEDVDRWRRTWKNHRDSYMDNFWGERGTFDADMVSDLDRIPMFAVNRMKSWLTSYEASLFYRGFTVDISPDEVYDNAELIDPQGRLVKAVLDRWLGDKTMRVVTRQGFTAGLLYTHAAFYLADNKLAKCHIDRVKVEFMPPWECVWDKRAASVEACRYMGRTWWMPIEDAESMFGLQRSVAEEKGALCEKPDVPTEGWRQSPSTAFGDGNYVRILDISFPRAPIAGPDGTPLFGKRCVYLLTPDGRKCHELLEVAIEDQDHDGRPDLNVEPIVLSSPPEYPLLGIASAATIYALECENNTYAAWLAQAFRFEALRKLFLDLSMVEPEGETSVLDTVRDHTVVKVKPGGLAQSAKAIASWMDPAPSPQSGLALRQFIEQHFEAVSGTAPFTRGQPTQYIPATESANLAAYTETAHGLIRGAMDVVVSNLALKYLRRLARLLRADGVPALPVRVEMDKDIVPLNVTALTTRWAVRIVDGANTPAKIESQKRDALQLLPMLVQLATSIDNPQNPAVTPAASAAFRALWNDLVKRFGLDERLAWEAVAKGKQSPPPPPPAPPVAEPAPAPQPAPAPMAPGITPEQQAALDSDAEAEATIAAMFNEGV